MKKLPLTLTFVLSLIFFYHSSAISAQNPCKLVTEEQITKIIKDFGFKKSRYVDGRGYFLGQSCEYFGNGKSVTITVEDKDDFAKGNNIFSSAAEKFEREQKAAAPGIIQPVSDLGVEAFWNRTSLTFLKNGSLYTVRVHAGKGLKFKDTKEIERVNLGFSKAIAKKIIGALD